MKVLSSIIPLLYLPLLIGTIHASDDWIQIRLINGNLLHGHLVKATDQNIHLVGAAINLKIPLEQVDEPSLNKIRQHFPILPSETQEPSASESLRKNLTDNSHRFQNTRFVTPTSRKLRRGFFPRSRVQASRINRTAARRTRLPTSRRTLKVRF